MNTVSDEFSRGKPPSKAGQDGDVVEEARPPRGPARRRPSGRRGGDSGTRDAVLVAARRQFAMLGYDRTTMRSVAMEAGVDQKLVAYFFVSKQQLFIAATELPVNQAEALPAVLAVGAEGTGERLAAHVVGILEDRSTRGQMTGLVRAAASEPQAAQMVRDLLTDGILVPVANSLAVDRPALRVALVSSQIVGLLMARYIIGIEPLASLPAEEVQALLAPTFQRYLVGELKK